MLHHSQGIRGNAGGRRPARAGISRRGIAARCPEPRIRPAGGDLRIFGPLALINPVKSLDEAIEKANSLPYALAAYAFTHSARNVDRLADGVEAGNLSINNLVASIAETPFGGIKESGYGREGGTEGLQHYTVVKNVSHLVM